MRSPRAFGRRNCKASWISWKPIESLETLLRGPAPEPVRLHPNLAELYRRQIEALHRALIHPATRDEAFAILRQLIERVTVHPREEGVEIELQGEIVAMV